MCERGLNREELIRAGSRLADRGSMGLAWQFVEEISKRKMRPSLKLNNSLMAAYGRFGRWDYAMSMLLRMQQDGIEPNEATFIGAIRAGHKAPLGGEFAEMLRPQLEAAVRREADAIGSEHATFSGEALSTLVRAQVRGATPSSAVASSSEAATIESGLTTLRRQIAEGTPPQAKLYEAALAACAAVPGRWQEAMQIISMMELWIRQERAPRTRSAWRHVEYPRAQDPAVVQAYTAAMASCDKSGNTEAAHALVPRLEELGVPLSAQVFVTAISACKHERDLPTAQALMQRMRRERLGPSTEAYNAMLGVISAVGGMGEDALALHDQMLRDAVRPDAITYVEMLSACKPTNEQARVLRRQAYDRRRQQQTGRSSRSHGSSSLGSSSLSSSGSSSYLDDAIPGSSGSDGAAAWGAPDGGYLPPHRRALDLLEGMQLRGIQPGVHHLAVAIELCERVSDLDEAFRLLLAHPALGLQVREP